MLYNIILGSRNCLVNERRHLHTARERLSEKICTRQSRKVTWDMINTLFLTLQLSNLYLLLCFKTGKLRLWPTVSFFQISLKNSELKTTQNAFQDCRVHFFRQPVSK